MGIFSSMGTPLTLRCERCNKQLHSGSGGLLIGGADVFSHLLLKAKQCPSCGKIFCGQCSIEVDETLGKPAGASDFSCPFCRRTGISG
jgi:hypothetical protein